MVDRDAVSMEKTYRLPGGQMVIAFTCPFPGDLPLVTILSEPDEVSASRTRLRDQVSLANELQHKPRYLQLLVDADRELHDVLMPALMISTVPAKRQESVA